MIKLAERVGPNAVIQLRDVLRDFHLNGAMLFAAAGVGVWWEQPPAEMIPEQEAARLHQAVRRHLAPEQARAVLREAGLRTADYLLLARIPRLAQIVLQILPPRLAAALLLRAIAMHAWTFAGSGVFSFTLGRTAEISIRANPFRHGEVAPAPICVWHQAVFERLFTRLVSRRVRVRETACCAVSGDECRFEVSW
jgi:divinyl protochlorophyllide a 8-vinyl-reductase